jgi:hypothetical protein
MANGRFSVTDLGVAVEHWRTHGFVLLPGYIPKDVLASAVAELSEVFPTADEFHDEPTSVRNRRYCSEFGGITVFPYPSVEMSLLAVHPLLTSLAEAILGTADIRIYASELWAKYTGAAEFDQEFHRDYLNHTPLVPSDHPAYGQLEMFVYLCDVPVDLGPPHFVSKTLTANLPPLPHGYKRDDRPDLYEHEVSGAGSAGTVVAYSVDTFHRGTELRVPRGARYTLMSNFRPAAHEWMTRHGWGDRSFEEAWAPFVERASVGQLRLFGFPLPGDAFWTEQTMRDMAARYQGMDLTPWRDARR